MICEERAEKDQFNEPPSTSSAELRTSTTSPFAAATNAFTVRCTTAAPTTSLAHSGCQPLLASTRRTNSVAATNKAGSDLGAPRMLRARARVVFACESMEVVEAAKVVCSSLNPAVRSEGRTDGATREARRRFHLFEKSLEMSVSGYVIPYRDPQAATSPDKLPQRSRAAGAVARSSEQLRIWLRYKTSRVVSITRLCSPVEGGSC